ncbi:MAG TPA: anti-sigma factor [Methylomirabilota bacterium]|nr:anti-sigma factor [Methylomirabilota bacterium]
MNGRHVIEDLAALALGSLERGEHARVEAHVATCASCAQHLADHREIAATLPLALTPAPPPPDLWPAILVEARRRRPGARRWGRVAGWTAVAAAVAGLIAWNVGLQLELARYAEGPQVEKLARRPARLVILKGSAAQPNASARVFAAVDGRSGHLAISGLPRLPDGRVYQLWFVPKTAPAAAAATFSVDAEGRAWVVIKVPGPLDDMRALIVTEEAAPGGSAPTGAALLEARDWR